MYREADRQQTLLKQVLTQVKEALGKRVGFNLKRVISSVFIEIK
jgi:hypothetical protein